MLLGSMLRTVISREKALIALTATLPGAEIWTQDERLNRR
jgi:hypothetical protein